MLSSTTTHRYRPNQTRNVDIILFPPFPAPLQRNPAPASILPSHSNLNSPISRPPPTLHILAIHPRRAFRRYPRRSETIATVEIHVFEVKGVDVAGEISVTESVG